jgi:hypothetical protein
LIAVLNCRFRYRFFDPMEDARGPKDEFIGLGSTRAFGLPVIVKKDSIFYGRNLAAARALPGPQRES